MKDILESLYSMSWWFSTVIVGLLINVASAYLKPPADRFLAKYSERRAKKLTEREEKLKRWIAEAVEMPNGVILCYLESIVRLLGVIAMLFIALVGTFFSMLAIKEATGVKYAFYVLSPYVPLIFAFTQIGRTRDALRVARRGRKQLRESYLKERGDALGNGQVSSTS